MQDTPLTLSIDCAMRALNLGLGDGSRLLGFECMNVGNMQSELLPDAVGEFLRRHRATLGDIGRIAVTVGPGYYTGIRVGLAYATALAESLSVGVVPVSTLHAMACGLSEVAGCIVPVLRARKEAVYAAIYSQKETVCAPAFYEVSDFAKKLTDLSLALPGELGEQSGENGQKYLLVGADAMEYPAIRSAGYPIVSAPQPIGANMILASREIAAMEPSAVEAVYLREPD